jgi:hypothetical protein
MDKARRSQMALTDFVETIAAARGRLRNQQSQRPPQGRRKWSSAMRIRQQGSGFDALLLPACTLHAIWKSNSSDATLMLTISSTDKQLGDSESYSGTLGLGQGAKEARRRRHRPSPDPRIWLVCAIDAGRRCPASSGTPQLINTKCGLRTSKGAYI